MVENFFIFQKFCYYFLFCVNRSDIFSLFLYIIDLKKKLYQVLLVDLLIDWCLIPSLLFLVESRYITHKYTTIYNYLTNMLTTRILQSNTIKIILSTIIRQLRTTTDTQSTIIQPSTTINTSAYCLKSP